MKAQLFLATWIGMGMMTLAPWAYADLIVSNLGSRNILQYDERTGEFLGEFIAAGSGGLGGPDGLLFGPDGNLYVCDLATGSILRYDGITGDPLPSPGNSGATFVLGGSGGLTFGGLEGGGWLIFGPDGNLYVTSGGLTSPPDSSSVLRFNGKTGEFIDAFVPSGSGGLTGPRGLVFGPAGHLYVNCNQPGPGSVLRYDGTTGAFLDIFVPAGSNPFGESGSGHPRGLVFGPDGNLYVGYPGGQAAHPSVLRYDGRTGAFLDAFVPEGSGGLSVPTGPLFGPDGNLYLRSGLDRPGAVLRYDGTTGTFIDEFVPYGSGGLVSNKGFVFRNSDPTTLAYVAVSRLHITAASTAVSGTAFDVTITALDANGNIDTGYQGTVTFSSSDAYPGLLPADYTFTSGDQGTHTFSGGVTLYTAGTQRLTVQDTADSTLTGNATVAVVAAPASQLLIVAASNVVSGTPFDVMLTALDPYANVDMNYGGTVTWTSSDTDPGVLLPADYTFQPTDNGVVTFPAGVMLITLGNQTLTAADTLSGISGNASVTVGP
jgi:sugar lactone lactonase YvrE